MMVRRRNRAGSGLGAVFALVLGCLSSLSVAATEQGASLDRTRLIEALRAGGLNIYFRHARTNWSQSDYVNQAEDWLDCDPARMRQLSDAGRADAITVGEAIRRLEIPIGEVLASPYCRTMESARLMKLGAVAGSTEVMNLRAAEFFGGREAIVASARRLLASTPPAGGNRIIVAHGNVAREATPAYPDEGEGLLFQPDSGTGFKLIGRLTPSQWKELAESFAD